MHSGGRAYARMPANALQRTGTGGRTTNEVRSITRSLEVASAFCVNCNETAGPLPVKGVDEACASEHVSRHRAHEEGRLRSRREPGRTCKGAGVDGQLLLTHLPSDCSVRETPRRVDVEQAKRPKQAQYAQKLKRWSGVPSVEHRQR